MQFLPLPPVAIPRGDLPQLDCAVREAGEEERRVADFLLSEMERAEIVEDDAVPEETVRLNQWVTYRVDWGMPAESRVLVLPEDFRNPASQVSVLSPIGAALLGLKAGAQMPYHDLEGRLHLGTAENLNPPVGVALFRAVRPRDNGEPDDDGPRAA